MPRKAADRLTTIGIDIGKNSFHLIGLDAEGYHSMRIAPFLDDDDLW
ncbi:MAG: hypothetical protein IH906_06460 [Proteobacteria bacterium]|nr:hypothetical protein [Pseudomonadota bacterium]MCH7931834.1 hypothetical protein [Pseudomonadota bacterium]